MSRLLTALLLVASGCAVGVAPGRDVVRHVEIDPAFSAGERATILAAMSNWESAPHVHFVEGAGDVHVLRVSDAAEVAALNAEQGRTDISGDTDENDTRIRLLFPAAAVNLEMVVTHELGHVLKVRYSGADPRHCTDSTACVESYMVPASSAQKRGAISAVDVDAVERLP